MLIRSLRALGSMIARHGLWRGGMRAVQSWRLERLLRWPRPAAKDERVLLKVLRSGRWGGYPAPNKYARQLAERFAELHSARFGVCVSSGSTALSVAYRALGIRPGDEVIVPALTFSATAVSALEIGARVVFVDVDPRTMCISHSAVIQAINSRTKAIVAVHLAAQMADMDALNRIATEHKLWLVEDCAHAHGAKWEHKGAGSLGNIGCFSFQSEKVMSAGEGGLIVTNDEELAEKCLSYTNCGRPASRRIAAHSILGNNYRMTELQAAILLAQLERLSDDVRLRAENMAVFSEIIASSPAVRLLETHPKVTQPPCYGYYFRYLCDEPGAAATVVTELRSLGVPAVFDMYRPVYRSPEFGWNDPWIERVYDYTRVSCPIAEKAATDELIWIPHPFFMARRRVIVKAAHTVVAVTGRSGRRTESFVVGSSERRP